MLKIMIYKTGAAITSVAVESEDGDELFLIENEDFFVIDDYDADPDDDGDDLDWDEEIGLDMVQGV